MWAFARCRTVDRNVFSHDEGLHVLHVINSVIGELFGFTASFQCPIANEIQSYYKTQEMQSFQDYRSGFNEVIFLLIEHRPRIFTYRLFTLVVVPTRHYL